MVKAKDIDLPAGVEILNPEALIATLEKKTKLEMYLTIGRGRGYSPADENKSDDKLIGVILIDSIFSPIRRAAYWWTCRPVGQRTDFDKLSLEVETDGSIEPGAAREAAEILIKSPAIFTTADRVDELRGEGVRRHQRRRRLRPRGSGRRRPRRDPDRGARAGRSLLQLPEAGRHPDGRRAGAKSESELLNATRTSAASRSRKCRRRFGPRPRPRAD